MTHKERLVFWRAWYELNTIRARDGVPQVSGPDGRCYGAGVEETYFSQIVDDMAAILGDDAAPWEPREKV